MSEEQRESGVFLGHTSCPKCGSRDNQGVYEKTKEDGSKYKDSSCFGCGHYIKPNDISEWLEINGFTASGGSGQAQMTQQQQDSIEGMRVAGWKARGIDRHSYEKFGCKAEAGDDGKPSWFYYPFYNSNKDTAPSGYKKKAYRKEQDSRGKEHRKTFTVGEVKKNKSQLFGQHLFDSGGKILVIGEGEDEAIAWWQTLYNQSGGKYNTPCVSIGFGAGSAIDHIKANYEFVTSFEKVLVAFDNDEAGKDAAEKVLRILKPGQGYRVNFKEHKDACDYLSKGKQSKLVDLFWKAEKFSPVDVCSLGDLWGDFENSVEDDIIELPPQFATLSQKMGGGPAHGEVTMVGALTSIGKSTIINNIAYHAAVRQGKKVGLMYLESSGKEMVSGFLSIHSEQNLAIRDRSELNMSALKKEFKDLIQDDTKFVVVRHDGAFRSIDEMSDKVRWMVKAAGCDIIIVDPLQAAVPDNSNDMLDRFMDSMLKLTKESNCSTLIVSHMRKPDGKNAHDIDEYALKGSSSINQIAFNTILLSRDKTHEDEKIRNSTKITLVKCRRTGNTGDAGWLEYDNETTKIREIPNPYEESEDSFGEDDVFGDVEGVPEPPQMSEEEEDVF